MARPCTERPITSLLAAAAGSALAQKLERSARLAVERSARLAAPHLSLRQLDTEPAL
jgi:hypothetical protein